MLIQLVLVVLTSGLVGALSGTAIDAVLARGDTTTQARQGALLAGLALAASPFASLPHWLARGSAYIPSPVSESAPSFSAGLHIGQLVHLVVMLILASGTGAVLGSTLFCRSLRRAGEARIFRIASGLFAPIAAMLGLVTSLIATASMTPRSATERPLLRLLGERGGTLTAGEAAARTGAPLELVERQLLALAVAAGADLRVGHDGSVAYRFPRHIRRLLLARSLRLRLQAGLGWLWRLLKGLVRVSVGGVLVLLAMLLISVLMLMGVLPASDAFIRSVLGLLLHAVQGVKQGVAGLIRGRPGAGQPVAFELDPAIREDLELLEQMFSVLFGDGDPNRDLEQRRWRRIGCFLAHRGGAVIADDLAPLLDLPPRPSDGERAMEIADAAMLPVLLRFDGRPEVSEQGELAYRFPSLQVHSELAKTPGGHSWAEALEVPSPPLRERRLVFSRAGSDVRWAYAVLCVLVLLLAPLLFGLFTPTPPLVAGLAWFAIGYALLLIVIPLLRLLTLRDRNRGIAARNSRRTSWGLSASVNTVGLARKRSFGRSFAHHHHLASGGLAYTTEEGLLEQQIES